MMVNIFHKINVIPHTLNSYLADTPLLWMLTTTDKVQTPAKAIGVWLEMTPTITDSCYYRITDTFLVQSDNFIGLTLNKADMLYFSYNIIM